MILVVGATGLLGSEICRELATSGQRFRAFTRVGSNPDRLAALKLFRAEMIRGDLKDRASLYAACRGVDVVISTASSTFSRRDGDSIETVDHQGQLDLVAAAELADVKRFVFVSFPSTETDFPLQAAKRAVEGRLRRSRLNYTILQPTYFLEVWWSPALGFDAAAGKAKIYGDGRNKMTPISFYDVAKFVVAAIRHPAVANATLSLGGPERLTPLEIVEVFEKAKQRKFAVEHIHEAALRAQWEAASDPMQKSFAGLALDFANAKAIDMTALRQMFPIRLKSVREFADGAG